MDKDGYHSYDKPSMKVEGPLHVICQCDKCKAQPQRTWVGLTDDEVYKIAFALEGEHWRKIADAIEAKLKEKNT